MPANAKPSAAERIAEMEQIVTDSRLPGVWKSNVRWLIAELRARDEALREARKGAVTYTPDDRLYQVHCPMCNCAWFRTTTGGIETPFAEWVRQCKHCGTQWAPSETPIYILIGHGERGNNEDLFTSLARTEGGAVE